MVNECEKFRRIEVEDLSYPQPYGAFQSIYNHPEHRMDMVEIMTCSVIRTVALKCLGPDAIHVQNCDSKFPIVVDHCLRVITS